MHNTLPIRIQDFAVGCGAFALMIALSFIFGEVNLPVILMCAAFALSLGGISAIFDSKNAYPVRLCLLLYFAFYYILPGITHLWIGVFPFFQKQYQPWSEAYAAALILIFLVAFFAGTLLPSKAVPKRRAHSLGDYGRLTAVTLVLSAVAIASVAVVGLASFRLARQDIVIVSTGMTPAVLMLTSTCRACVFLVYLIAVGRLMSYRNKINDYLIVAAPSLILFLYLCNPANSARNVLGAYALASIFTFFADWRRVKAWFVPGFVIAQLTLFPLVDSIGRGGGASTFTFNPLRYLSTHGDFDGYQSTINVVEMVVEKGTHHGVNLLSALLFFLPRGMAPWKSPGTGAEAAGFSGYDFFNISSPLPAELFVDFGLVGLPILAFLVGYGVQRLDIRHAYASHDGDVIGKIIPAVAAGFIVIVARGSLVAVIGPAIITIAIAWLSQRALRVRQGQSDISAILAAL